MISLCARGEAARDAEFMVAAAHSAVCPGKGFRSKALTASSNSSSSSCRDLMISAAASSSKPLQDILALLTADLRSAQLEV